MWQRAVGPAVAAVATFLIRLPGLQSTLARSFDEGVYGASVLAVRSGGLPFRDVFSSQGPLFLPLLWAADVVGPGHVLSLRLFMAVVAIAVALGVYAVVSLVAGRLVATVAGVVTGLSGVVIGAAGPVQSDGIALAFAVWAVALALGWGRLRGARPVVVGFLLGAAVATKSLFAIPAVVAVTWRHRTEWRRLAAAGFTAVGVIVAASLPWGVANVWDQSVVFQLEVPRNRSAAESLSMMWDTLRQQEPLVAAFLGGGLLLGLSRWAARPPERGDKGATIVVWFVATLLLLIFGVELGQGFERFIAFLVPPLLAAVALLRPPGAALAVAVVAVIPWHVSWNADLVWSSHLIEVHREVIAILDRLPEGAEVLSDRPALLWAADRHPPGDLVDPSWARIQSGRVDAGLILEAAQRPEVCAVLFYTNRFDFIDPNLEKRLDGYRLERAWGDDRRLHVAERCLPASSGTERTDSS